MTMTIEALRRQFNPIWLAVWLLLLTGAVWCERTLEVEPSSHVTEIK